MNETAISTTALDLIDAEIRDALTAFIKEKSLPIKLVTMTVGRANPPDAIKNQRIETAAQEQRSNTEKQQPNSLFDRVTVRFRSNLDLRQFPQIEPLTTIWFVAARGSWTENTLPHDSIVAPLPPYFHDRNT